MIKQINRRILRSLARKSKKMSKTQIRYKKSKKNNKKR